MCLSSFLLVPCPSDFQRIVIDVHFLLIFSLLDKTLLNMQEVHAGEYTYSHGHINSLFCPPGSY